MGINDCGQYALLRAEWSLRDIYPRNRPFRLSLTPALRYLATSLRGCRSQHFGNHSSHKYHPKSSASPCWGFLGTNVSGVKNPWRNEELLLWQRMGHVRQIWRAWKAHRCHNRGFLLIDPHLPLSASSTHNQCSERHKPAQLACCARSDTFQASSAVYIH